MVENKSNTDSNNNLIVVDTSFLVGIFVTNDQWHKKAMKKLNYVDKKEKIITNQIINETINLICKKIGANEAKNIYEYLIDNYTIIEEDRDLYNKAIDTMLKYNCKLSLTDSTIIEIMKELNINKIASFDSDFDNKEKIVRIH